MSYHCSHLYKPKLTGISMSLKKECAKTLHPSWIINNETLMTEILEAIKSLQHVYWFTHRNIYGHLKPPRNVYCVLDGVKDLETS